MAAYRLIRLQTALACRPDKRSAIGRLANRHREDGTEDHRPEDGAAGDRFLPDVEQQCANQRANPDRNRGGHCAEDDQGTEEAAGGVTGPIITSAP